jgi:hypothetical protein
MYTVRATSLRFALVLVLSVSVLVLLLLFGGGESVYAMADGEVIHYSGVRTKEERMDFLKQFGIEVKEESEQTENFTVSETLDRVLLSYNELQKKQGLDLSKYRSREVKRYTYKVTNFPDYSGTVMANVIVYKNRVIGGDLCSSDVTGFICGFEGKK